MKFSVTFTISLMFIMMLSLEPCRTALAETSPIQSMDLSIEQAVMAALQNNRDLRIRKLEPVKTGTFEQMEKAAFDPELYAAYTYNREDGVNQNRSLSTEKNHETVLGLGKSFATGTRVDADVTHERASETDTPELQSTRLGLSMTQSLLRGFGPQVNLAQVRKAALETKISVYQLKGYTEVLLAETENAYWNYVLAKRKIAIFEQSLSVAEQQRDEIEQQIAIGMLPKMEAAAVRSEVALRKQDLIDAQSLSETYRLALLHLIDPDRLDVSVNPVSVPDLDIKPIKDTAERITLAQNARSDVNEARLRLEQNRLDIVVTKNGLLPRLDFFVSIGRTGYGDSLKETFKNEDPNFAGDLSLGLSLTHVLGNRSAKASDQAASISRDQAELALENMLAKVRLDVKLAVNEVERLRKQIKATHVTRLSQEETYAAEKERFRVGSSTSLIVSRTQRDLLSFQIFEVETIVNFRMALIDLYLAEGSLLELRGVGVGE